MGVGKIESGWSDAPVEEKSRLLGPQSCGGDSPVKQHEGRTRAGPSAHCVCRAVLPAQETVQNPSVDGNLLRFMELENFPDAIVCKHGRRICAPQQERQRHAFQFAIEQPHVHPGNGIEPSGYSRAR